MRAVICGANGAMGKLIGEKLGAEVVGRVSIDGENGAARTFDELGRVDADIVIDFSHHTAISAVLDYAKKIGAAAVIGTTGHTEEEKALIFAAAKEIPIFYSGNMSLGIAVLCRLAKEAARYFPDADIEIVEAHHNRKVDAPSGTALMLFNAIREVRPDAWANCGRSGEGKRTKEEIGISALRLGTTVGMHEVILHTGTQQLTLRHEAVTRAMLADGAVDAARFVLGKPLGLYNMESLLNQERSE
ncbi:MAG TPA: 4-hydroxy-tetrahydrodipicolinate reductase [Clostridiales bacterium]|nr:4-hydroxy-tetrahydrodipicolinate reductase [Clostridiales bacterium]